MVRRRRRLDPLGRIMSKVSRGQRLSRSERKMLSCAIDATRKARSEKRGRRRRSR